MVWGKLGELCNQYLAKGRQVFVEGKIQTRSWDDQSGQKKYVTEVSATNVQFLGDAKMGAGKTTTTEKTVDNNEASNVFEQDFSVSTDANYTHDDIPF
ncbi:MAG: hypothetical protein A2577_15310 [Bdellovibrionales bacterium RIFOXYD1_FULL_36_51]|nr:MAG: hypothetical protein A2577_15310 [Bdellovibrionales bacterium RIFOXYD1_FULL_36_51]